MSIFGKIKDAIFGKAEAAEPAAPPQSAPPPAGPVAAPASPTPTVQPTAQPSATTPARPTAPTPTAPTAPTAPTGNAAPVPTAAVDVAAIMDKAVKDSGQTLDWRKSIVDTMKALHLDSSLSERKELAQELGYTGDTNDSGTMNVWLHKALMKKLSENGGKVPADLTD